MKRGFRVAALPVIALFANLSMPTQAALPELTPSDWTDLALGGAAQTGAAGKTARLAKSEKRGRVASVKDGRWWSFRRGLSGQPQAAAGDPDQAMARAFPPDSIVALPVLAGLSADGRNGALAAAYAPYDPSRLILAPFTPPVREGDHAWMKRPLPAHVYAAEEQECLATAIYFEARGESAKGQAAVAQVILNRIRNPAYPDTICDVVYQNAELRNRCQFSFACDGIADRVRRPGAWWRAEKIALAVTRGETFVSEIGSATHYFADYVRPKWAGSMDKMASIGTHQFFRTRGGGWK